MTLDPLTILGSILGWWRARRYERAFMARQSLLADPLAAIDFALFVDGAGDASAGDFLRDWNEGNYDAWPDYVAFIDATPWARRKKWRA